MMDPVAGVVDAWLQADRDQPVKQRHTAHRVWQRLVEEQEFTGAEPTVRRWVRERKTRLGWNQTGAVVPLDPEHAREAEVAWGTAWVRMNGQDCQVKLFCMRSRYSGKAFVRAYRWKRQEMFLDGHIRGFDWYGGVFPTLTHCVRSRLRRELYHPQRSSETFRLACKIAPICLIPCAARSTSDSVMAPVMPPRSYLAQGTTSGRYLPSKA